MKRKPPQFRKISETHHNKATVACEVIALPDSHCCTILENISEGVFTIDLKKRITYFNPAAETITGFKAQEALEQHCFDIFRADICETRCCFDKALDCGDRCLNHHASIISKSGEKKPVSIVTSVLKDRNGQVIGGVESFRDLSEMEEMRRQLSRSFIPEDIVGRHPKMRQILSFLPDIAESDSPVLIWGPTESGKELIARAVHNLSPRKDGPFIAVNCAALPDTLLGSELFGYTKGAFTGATKNKAGRFALADQGTLFLDEISNTSLAFQADLLRVLEYGEFTPLGETKTSKADFRLVTATNEDLTQLIAEGSFRQDLYYRLNVAKISLPALRERKEDIPLLIEHLIHKYNLLKKRSIEGVTPEVLALLMDHPFPGNIRELENIIEYAFIACKGRTIGRAHLPADLLEVVGEQNAHFIESLTSYENEDAKKIRALLDHRGGNRQKAARALGLSRTTLWRRMKRYGILI